MKVVPCKYCKRSKAHVSVRADGKIEKEICIYCNGKGYIVQKENEVKGGEKNVLG